MGRRNFWEFLWGTENSTQENSTQENSTQKT